MTHGFTSGARRRNDLTALLERTQITHVRSVAAVNECHAATERINPILDAFRDDEYGHDAVFEWLFQLGRVWSDWVITAPFPVENYQADGPAVDYPASLQTGQDAAYWEIEYAIRGYVSQIDGVGIIDYDDGGWGFTVTTGHHMLRRVEICDEVAARLQHAVTVLTRLLTGFESAA